MRQSNRDGQRLPDIHGRRCYDLQSSLLGITPTAPPSDISRTKPLIRFGLNQIGRRLTEHLNAVMSFSCRDQLTLHNRLIKSGALARSSPGVRGERCHMRRIAELAVLPTCRTRD